MSLRAGLVLSGVAVIVAAAALLIGQDRLLFSQALGPKDGHDLPPTDLDRVAVGDMAPDFSLRALSGDVITLSDLRGDKNVVLVFYRGHW